MMRCFNECCSNRVMIPALSIEIRANQDSKRKNGTSDVVAAKWPAMDVPCHRCNSAMPALSSIVKASLVIYASYAALLGFS